MKKHRSFLFAILLAGALMFNVSCKDSASNPVETKRGKHISIGNKIELDSNWFNDQLSDVPISSFELISYKEVIEEIRTKAPKIFLPVFTQFNYKSLNNKKQETELSGLLIFPFSLNKSEISNLPVICLTHGTQIMRKLAPSCFNLKFAEFPEVTLGLAMASAGFVVIMPDYQGMGKDESEFHPFCIGELLGVAAADMVSALRDFVAKDKDNIPFGLSDKNFFLGYSEGGYATLAATREFEKTYPNLKLTGSAPMSGPYDLSGTMAGVMVADTAFPIPYFLPYVIRGYQEVYPDVFSWEKVLREPYRTTIPPVLDGYHNGNAINAVMPQNRILKQIFNESFINDLKNPNSEVFKKLHNNDLWHGWSPKTSVLLIHCKQDDCVPYNNTVTTYNYFRDTLKLSNVEKFEPELYLPLSETIHINAAPGCFLGGFLWIVEKSK